MLIKSLTIKMMKHLNIKSHDKMSEENYSLKNLQLIAWGTEPA